MYKKSLATMVSALIASSLLAGYSGTDAASPSSTPSQQMRAVSALASSASGQALVSRVILRDPRGDVRYVYEDADNDWGDVVERPAADVVRARVRHGLRMVVVRMRFINLRRVGSQHYQALVSTPQTMRDQTSPYMFVVRSTSGNWGGKLHVYDDPYPCLNMRHHISYAREVVRLQIPRRCLAAAGSPRWVRVELNNGLSRDSDLDAGYFFADNPFNRLPWADESTRRLYPR